MLTRCRAPRRSRSYALPEEASQPIITGALRLGSGLQNGLADLRGRQEATQKHTPHFCHTCSISKDSISGHSPPPRLCFALTQKEDKGLHINSLKSETTDIPSLSTPSLGTGEPMTVQIKETASLSLIPSYPILSS